MNVRFGPLMPRHRLLLLPLSALLLNACNLPMRIEPQRPAAVKPAPHPAAVALAGTTRAPALSADARSALALAAARVAEAKRERPDWIDADNVLVLARTAAAQGDSARTISLSKQAMNWADLSLGGQFLAQANAQLQKLYAYTGLSDTQLAHVQEAEAAIARNDGRAAYELTNALSEELRNSQKRHKVGRGESLWTISAREDIYANPFLWPLIWQTNKDTVKNPSNVREGQVLKIRPNPTVNEVVEAVTYAREHTGTKINIGEVREVKPAQ